MNDKFSLPGFITAFLGTSFKGDVKMWSRKTRKTSSYGPNDIAKLALDVEKRKHTEDLYLGLSTQPSDLGPKARGSNDTAISLPGVFADIDFANAKDSTKSYPPDSDTALALIHSFEVQPFYIHHSGNGFHVLYAFDKPLVMSTREERRKAQAMLRLFH